jgi:hypothetical protein
MALNHPIKIHQINDPLLNPNHGSSNKIQEHICRNRFITYLNNREADYFGHHRQWVNMCFELAGKAFASLKQDTFSHIQNAHGIYESQIKRTFHQLTNDKYMNTYFKFKIEVHKNSTDKSFTDKSSSLEVNDIIASINHVRNLNANALEPLEEATDEELLQLCDDHIGDRINLPNCPCCSPPSTTNPIFPKDSITHMLFECANPEIKAVRDTTLRNLHSSTDQLQPHLRPQFKSLLKHLTLAPNERLVSKDSRSWAGVFHQDVIVPIFADTENPIKSSTHLIAFIQKQTLPAAHHIWRLYCHLSHLPDGDSLPHNPPTRPSRKNTQQILSFDKNNHLGSFTPNYQIPSSLSRRRPLRKNPTHPTQTKNPESLPTIPQFFLKKTLPHPQTSHSYDSSFPPPS